MEEMLWVNQSEGGAYNKVTVSTQTIALLFPPKADGLCLGCSESFPPWKPDTALCPASAQAPPSETSSKHACPPMYSRSKASHWAAVNKSSVLKCSRVYLRLALGCCNYKPVILACDSSFWSLLDPWPSLFFLSAACRLRSGVCPPPFFLLQNRTEKYYQVLESWFPRGEKKRIPYDSATQKAVVWGNTFYLAPEADWEHTIRCLAQRRVINCYSLSYDNFIALRHMPWAQDLLI